MEQAPLGWRWLEKAECYGCMCGFHVVSVSKCKYHISEEVQGGYCDNGFRAISESHYECICGNVFETVKSAWKHRTEIFNQCIDKAKYKARGYCTKCELQFKTPYDLERHLLTPKHIEGDGPVLKNLHCEVCDVSFRGQKEIKRHLNTPKHKQMLEHGSLSLECRICGITCRGQKQMLAHLETKKHKKLLTNEATKMGEHITRTAEIG